MTAFPVTIEIPVAWGDMDAFGHVNNTAYLRWCESARIAYFDRCGVIKTMTERGVGPILAQATVKYVLPLKYPDVVKASASVRKVGNSSFTMEYRITSRANRDETAATGEAVMVMVDYRGSGGKVPVDAELRQTISALEGTGF